MAASSRTRASPFISSSFPSRKYDVFLSFRGEDTRTNFTDHLFAALVREGFSTFRDDDKLDRGEDIAIELLKAIEDSRISLVVFSNNYADSRWCLDELVKILECKRNLEQMVVPVFYKVDPSDVRKHRGSFAQAFAKHEKSYPRGEMANKVKSWRAALTEAANLSGWGLSNKKESEFIEEIVEDISKKLNLAYLSVALYPVGIESRVQKVKVLLSMGSDKDVRMVGIWGIGGLGKTTIAKAIYNQFKCKFEGSSFLANVREHSKQANGLVDLQEQLISDVLRRENQKVRNVDRGIEVIKQRVLCKRVLLVLDDVDNIEQLKALALSHEWFHTGSKIIVTTRDKFVLEWMQVDGIYTPDLLNECESLQLFSWHAFRKQNPVEEYAELSSQVVGYAKQLPLALEVLGSFLFGKNKREWESTLEKLQVIHPDAIQEKLRISFDSLDAREKGLFLDIACFFVGSEQTNEVMNIFKGCGYFPEIGIGNLCRQGLLKIDGSNCLMMHDLIRDMGREIVREECPEEPGKRSRLWLQEDVLDVLTDNTGTQAVEGIVLRLPVPIISTGDVKEINASAFAKMKRLRLLRLDYVKVSGSYEYFSKRLIWLCWRGFQKRSIPPNLCMDKLVVLDMSGFTALRRPWNGPKMLNKLKFLNFSCSYHLEIPDLSGLICLEGLLLKDCDIRDQDTLSSIGTLTSLTTLDLRHNSFSILPASISRLPRLECLYLDECSRLLSLPELPINIQRLTAQGCYKLERIPIESNWWQQSPFLDLCGWRQNEDLAFKFKESLLRHKEPESGHDQFSILLACIGKLPSWFNYQSIGPLLSFVVSPLPDHGKIVGYILCVDTAHCGNYFNSNEVHPCYHIINITKGLQLREQAVHGIGSQYPQRWFTYNLGHKYEVEMETGDDVQFLVTLNSDICEVKEIGVNLIYEAELSY